MIVIPTGTHTADDSLKRFIREFLYFLIFHAATLLCFSHSMEHELSNLFISFYHGRYHSVSRFLRKKILQALRSLSITACKISTLPDLEPNYQHLPRLQGALIEVPAGSLISQSRNTLRIDVSLSPPATIASSISLNAFLFSSSFVFVISFFACLLSQV